METLLKNHRQKGGRKRPADAEFVINQVKQRFGEKMVELGARNAAAEIGVGLASFYNYINGKTVPDIDVLRRAKEVWNIKWPKLMDPSAVLPRGRLRTPEQYVMSFLDALEKDDVQVVKIGPKGYKTLQVTLNIRFTA